MQEQVLLQAGGGVRITTARANLGGKTYAMRNVTSVSMTRSMADRSFGKWVMAAAILVTIFSAIGGAYEVTIIGVIGVFLGMWFKSIPDDRYHVVLGSASGENEALTSTDHGFVTKVVDALNDAIVMRG